MQDHVVTELKPTPRQTPVEVVYSLTAEDYVAYWICLSRRGEMPKRAQKAMREVVAPVLVVPTVVSLMLSGFLSGAYPSFGFPCLITTVVSFVFAHVIMLGRIDHRPSACFQGWLSKPYRWLCLWALRRLARSEAQEGTLDTQSLYRFAMNAEGFTLKNGPIVPQGDGCCASREDRVPWSVLQDVVFDKEHVFFLIRKGVAAIIPRQAFSDSADFDQFVALVRCYRSGMPLPPTRSTAICILEERLLSHPPR